MPTADRRQYVRVSFESTFEVRTAEWSDPVATGLDISLNGCRFNCEKSMSDGETVTLAFEHGFELEGNVRWCWPIEWYFQAAVHFAGISPKKQIQLKAYIEEVTGEDFQMELKDEATPETIAEAEKSLTVTDDEIEVDDDLGDLVTESEEEEDLEIDEDELEELPPLEEEDLLEPGEEEPLDSKLPFSETSQHEEFLHEFAEGDLNPRSFAGSQVIIYDVEKKQTELLSQYLTERAGMEVECVSKRQNLWRLLKLDPLDLVIIETGANGNSDSLEVMQQTKDQFPEVHFICLSSPVSLDRRLQYLNAGALDYLTRPVHLSTVAQSVLIQLNRAEGDFSDGFAHPVSEAVDIPAEKTLIDSSETYPDEDLSDMVSLLDEDLDLPQEIDLIDEDF